MSSVRTSEIVENKIFIYFPLGRVQFIFALPSGAFPPSPWDLANFFKVPKKNIQFLSFKKPYKNPTIPRAISKNNLTEVNGRNSTEPGLEFILLCPSSLRFPTWDAYQSSIVIIFMKNAVLFPEICEN